MAPVDKKTAGDGTARPATKDANPNDGTTIRPARPTPRDGAATDGSMIAPSSRLPSLLYGRNRTEAQESPVDRVKVDIHRRLIDRLDLEALERLTQKDEVITQIRIAVAEFLRDEPTPLSHAEREEIVEHIVWEVTGLGPIEPYFRDPTISDILVNNARNIFIERGGVLTRVPVQFRNDAHVLAVIDRIVSRVGRRVDESSPMVDARLPDGSRVNAIIPPLALDGPVLSIRRFGTDLTAQHLLSFGSVTADLMRLLDGCVKARLNVLISGGTGSGKTTLLNVLSALIPSVERLITIEDAAELRLQQEHVVRLETRPPNAEGRGEVIARDLVKNALRMRPDRIIVGEVRGPEALDMLQAMNTGHEGSLSTIHANSPRDALARLETMILMAGTTLPSRAMREQIASALDVVIQVTRLPDGTRRVVSVTEITGMEGDVVTTQELFRFRRRGITNDGKVEGQFEWAGVRPGFAERLRVAGVDVQSLLFQ
jgi:pilus assembly protein CpaF